MNGLWLNRSEGGNYKASVDEREKLKRDGFKWKYCMYFNEGRVAEQVER